MESVGTDVDKRLGIALEQGAPDDPAEENPVVAGDNLPGDLGVKVGQRCGEHLVAAGGERRAATAAPTR